MSRRAPGLGFGVFDTRLSADTLVAKGAGALQSAYTQDAPVPGQPVIVDTLTGWRPSIRGAQSQDLTALTLRGGYPGREGAGIAYRLGSDDDDEDYRGWQDPGLVTGWSAPAEYQDEDWGTFTACLLPTHEIVVIARASTGEAQTWRYNPRSGVWTAAYDWATGPGLSNPIMLAADPLRPSRVILWSGNGDPLSRDTIAYYSDDGGDTWLLYSIGIYDDDTSADRGSVAVDPTLDWVMFHNGIQWASSDRGASWEAVETLATGTGHLVVRGPAGYVVVYLSATNRPKARVLLSARSSFEATTEIDIDGTSMQDIVPVVDFDGRIYAYGSMTDDTGTIYLCDSTDGGNTWGAGPVMGIVTVDISKPTWDVGVAAAGAIYMFGGTNAAINMAHACQFGGWSNVDQGSGGTDLRGRWVYFDDAGVYLPYDTPANQGFTTTNTGTIDLTPAVGEGLQLITTALQVSVHSVQILAGIAVGWAAGECCLQVNSGQSAATSSIVFAMSIQDGAATGYGLSVHFGTDGIEVRDGTNVRATQALTTDGSAGQVHVRIQLRQSGGSGWGYAWYKLGEGTAWTLLADTVGLTQGAIGASVITFGHGIGAGDSTWRMAGGGVPVEWRWGLQDADRLDLTPASQLLGLEHGRAVPGAGFAYPVPDATAADEDMGYVAATGGPTYSREPVGLPTGYTYALDNVHPDSSASPTSPWRATDTSEVRLVYDQGSDRESWYGGAVFLAALRADFREAILQSDDGGGGVSTLGTLDKGWGSINYTRTGRTLTPRAATAVIDRYFAENELVGGYVIMSTATDPVGRRIVSQSAGYWTADTNLPRIRIEVSGITGAEDVSGSGSIVHHSGVLVVYPSADTPRRYLRVRITSGQVVPDAGYAAGILDVGRVVGVGAEAGWDWARGMELSRSTSRGPDRGLRVRRTGPRRRTLTYGWPEGVDLLAMRLTASAPDWVGASGGAPIGTEQDAWSSPIELLDQQLRAGEVPAILFARLPGATNVITDPTLYLYGRLLSDGVGVSSVRGTEGRDELLRVDSLSFEEIP